MRITRAAAHLSLEEVKKRMTTELRPLSRQRWLIIYHALGERGLAEDIARYCGVSKATVHAVISSYNRLGVAAVETPGKGGRRSGYLSVQEKPEFLTPFFGHVEKGELATTQEIWRAFEARVGQQVDESTISRLLSRPGWRKLMPRPRHLQADLQAQQQFKKTHALQVKAAVATQDPEDERPVLILAQDEGRFGRPQRCWAPPGIRPLAPAQLIRESVSIFAAVAPMTGEPISLILPEASTAMMNLFPEEVSQTFSKSFIVMQVDGASWYSSHDLVVSSNIRLIKQPPYSPQVNPVEHLWDELREKHLHNRACSSLDALIEVLCLGLNDLADDPATLHDHRTATPVERNVLTSTLVFSTLVAGKLIGDHYENTINRYRA